MFKIGDNIKILGIKGKIVGIDLLKYELKVNTGEVIELSRLATNLHGKLIKRKKKNHPLTSIFK